MQRFFTMVAALLAFSSAARAADTIESLRSWSSVEANLHELSKGKIATSTNASMNLARGMSCQAVFVVNAPLETTWQALLKFNATRHAELEVFQHHVFHGESDSGFDKLLLNPKVSAGAATIRSMGDASAIQLAKGEVALMPKQRTAEAAQQFLSTVLRGRWSRFSKSGDFGSVGTHDAGGELRTLLAEEGKVTKHFGALLAPVTAKAAPGTPKFSYWDLSIVDKKYAAQLGTVYTAETPDRRQVFDATFYSSYGYLVSITLTELLPVIIDGKAQTLVWQGSLVSTTGIEGGLGLKRKIGARMMTSDVEKWIRIFRAEAQGAR
jgi:hypothetical protein